MKNNYKYFMMAAAASLALCSCDDDDSVIGGSDAAILACEVASNGITFDGGVMGNEVMVNLPMNADLENLKVDFRLSEGAQVSPQPALITNWSEPVTFRVVSANQENERNYTVNMVVDSDHVFDTSVSIGNKEALEKFAENGYTVLGGLRIFDDYQGDPIEDLSSLDKVREVKTDLQVITDAIGNINMESLEYVGNVDIISYSAESVSFPELVNVAGRFRIGNDEAAPVGNFSLTSLDLSSLEAVGKSFVLHYCETLADIKMPEFKYVGEHLSLDGGSYKDLSMIEHLTEVNGGVTIFSKELQSLKGFNIERIEHSLSLCTGKVESLEPLAVLKSVGYVNIFGSKESKISSFKGLENVEVREAMDIKAFPEVKSTKYLPVKNGMDHISLQGLIGLESLEGFEQVTEIGDLYLVQLSNLSDLHQLNGLAKVRNLVFDELNVMEYLPEMSKLTKVEGNLTVSKMLALKDLKGLSQLKEAGSVKIDNLVVAESLTGLEQFEQVTKGGLTIGACPKIKDLAPLAHFKEANMPEQKDMIYIAYNENLVDFTAVKDVLMKYYKEGSRKFPKVKLTGNKYNPTYEQLENGQCTPPEE